MSDPDYSTHNLVIPFIACESKGGPYDDQAFAAGWQAGRIDYALAAIAAVGGSELRATVCEPLVEQLDLVAMHHGFTMETEPAGETDGWSFVTFRAAT